MNWLLAVIILYVVIKAVWSYKKGFARMLLSIFTAFFALFLVWLLAPSVKNFLLEHTDAEEVLTEKVEEILSEKLPAVVTEPELEDRLPVPEALMELLSEKLEGWRMTGVREVSKGFAGLLISAASYGLLYLFLWLALKILGYVLRLVTRIPGIRQMDGLAGMALGLLEAYILIGILFILITAFTHTEAGIYLLEQINDSSILTFMYNHNYLLRIISM